MTWGGKSASRNSPVVCDEYGHTKFLFLLEALSWGELWLICPELPLMLGDLVDPVVCAPQPPRSGLRIALPLDFSSVAIQ